MLDNATDVPERLLGKAGVDVTGHDILAALRKRLMHVHAAAVVPDKGLRHERRGLAELRGDLLHDVLERQDLVRLGHQLITPDPDFALAGGSYLMMMNFDDKPHLFERIAHLRTDVLESVYGGHWEVATFHAGTVPHVAAVQAQPGRPSGFTGDDSVARAAHGVLP